MTDNEIIKALECCINNNCTYDCPFYYDSCIKCKYSSSEIMEFAFDLINRQKAEIERLNKEVDRLSQCVMYHDGQIADAIKDLTEKLYEKIEQNSKFGFDYVTKKEIENVVRELEEIKERF